MDPQTTHQAVQAASPILIVGNMAWNAMLIGALGFLISHWMKGMEDKVSKYCDQNREEHGAIFKRLENHSERIAVVEDRTKGL